MRFRSRGRDPYWITARYSGRCGAHGCEQIIKAGDRAFYYPNSRTLLAVPCGHAEKAEGETSAAMHDERFIASQFPGGGS